MTERVDGILFFRGKYASSRSYCYRRTAMTMRPNSTRMQCGSRCDSR
jgi:hypothetical protein